MKDKSEELTLLLLYLNSWEEDGYGIDDNGNITEKIKRSWKGYDFDTLNVLEEKNYLRGSHKSKSVCLTKIGENKAKELYTKYFGRDI